MKVALVNPPWHFENSIYFGCREPHLPDRARRRTAAAGSVAGHQVLLLDGHLNTATFAQLADQVADFPARDDGGADRTKLPVLALRPAGIACAT